MFPKMVVPQAGVERSENPSLVVDLLRDLAVLVGVCSSFRSITCADRPHVLRMFLAPFLQIGKNLIPMFSAVFFRVFGHVVAVCFPIRLAAQPVCFALILIHVLLRFQYGYLD